VLLGLALVWITSACGGKSEPVPPVPDAGPLECPGATEIGTAGGITTETFPLVWGPDGVASVDLVVPDDLSALELVAEDGQEFTAFSSVRQSHRGLVDLDTDPDGLRGPFFHTWNYSSSLVFPTNEDSSMRPGCLRVEALTDGPGITPGTLHVLSRRATGGALRVDLVRVGTTELPGASLDALATELLRVLDATGLSFDTQITPVELDGDPFPPADGPATLALRASYRPSDPSRIPIYVIQGFVDELDTLGIAGGIPGPNGVAGAASAGVLVAVDPHLDESGAVDVLVMAETIAHELGHQLGLFHTSEADGRSHDPLGDTDECDASRDDDGDGDVSAEECAAVGGRNLMFWVSASFPQRELSPWQRRVLELQPVVR
jgi:hypothetical protein